VKAGHLDAVAVKAHQLCGTSHCWPAAHAGKCSLSCCRCHSPACAAGRQCGVLELLIFGGQLHSASGLPELIRSSIVAVACFSCIWALRCSNYHHSCVSG
jgi:hypothetical protein